MKGGKRAWKKAQKKAPGKIRELYGQRQVVRPWDDRKTGPSGNGELTDEMLLRAVKVMGEVSLCCPSRPRVYTKWAFASEEDCIEYFKGTGIVVVDRKGNEWLDGEPYKEESA